MAKPFDRGALVRAGAFALLPAAIGAGGLAVAPLAGVAGVAGVRPELLREAVNRHRIALILLLCFIGWAILSTLWTPFPDHSQSWRLAATVGGGLLFAAWGGAPVTARVIRAAGLAAVLVAIVLLGIEAFADMPFNRAAQPGAETWVLLRNPGRGVSVLVVIVWGALGTLLGRGGPLRRVLGIALAGVVGLLSAQFDQQANLAAFAIALIAFGAGYAAPRYALIGMCALLALWLLIAPFVLPGLAQQQQLVAALPDTWAIRAEVWRFASERALEQPFFGYGLDGPRTFTDEIVVRGQTMHAIQLHPHSASLQIWLETGVIGALLGAAALAFAGLKFGAALQANRVAAASACATLAAIGVMANVSYGAWQEWWVATAFVAAAMVAALATSAKA